MIGQLFEVDSYGNLPPTLRNRTAESLLRRMSYDRSMWSQTTWRPRAHLRLLSQPINRIVTIADLRMNCLPCTKNIIGIDFDLFAFNVSLRRRHECRRLSAEAQSAERPKRRGVLANRILSRCASWMLWKVFVVSGNRKVDSAVVILHHRTRGHL